MMSTTKLTPVSVTFAALFFLLLDLSCSEARPQRLGGSSRGSGGLDGEPGKIIIFYKYLSLMSSIFETKILSRSAEA